MINLEVSQKVLWWGLGGVFRVFKNVALQCLWCKLSGIMLARCCQSQTHKLCALSLLSAPPVLLTRHRLSRTVISVQARAASAAAHSSSAAVLLPVDPVAALPSPPVNVKLAPVILYLLRIAVSERQLRWRGALCVLCLAASKVSGVVWTPKLQGCL